MQVWSVPECPAAFQKLKATKKNKSDVCWIVYRKRRQNMKRAKQMTKWEAKQELSFFQKCQLPCRWKKRKITMTMKKAVNCPSWKPAANKGGRQLEEKREKGEGWNGLLESKEKGRRPTLLKELVLNVRRKDFFYLLLSLPLAQHKSKGGEGGILFFLDFSSLCPWHSGLDWHESGENWFFSFLFSCPFG